jgi:hypothetical protein
MNASDRRVEHHTISGAGAPFMRGLIAHGWGPVEARTLIEVVFLRARRSCQCGWLDAVVAREPREVSPLAPVTPLTPLPTRTTVNYDL